MCCIGVLFPPRKCWNVPALELIMLINIILVHTDLSIFVIVILTEYILDNLIKVGLFTRLAFFFILHLQVFFYLETRGVVQNKSESEAASSILAGAQQRETSIFTACNVDVWRLSKPARKSPVPHLWWDFCPCRGLCSERPPCCEVPWTRRRPPPQRSRWRWEAPGLLRRKQHPINHRCARDNVTSPPLNRKRQQVDANLWVRKIYRTARLSPWKQTWAEAASVSEKKAADEKERRITLRHRGVSPALPPLNYWLVHAILGKCSGKKLAVYIYNTHPTCILLKKKTAEL